MPRDIARKRIRKKAKRTESDFPSKIILHFKKLIKIQIYMVVAKVIPDIHAQMEKSFSDAKVTLQTLNLRL